MKNREILLSVQARKKVDNNQINMLAAVRNRMLD